MKRVLPVRPVLSVFAVAAVLAVQAPRLAADDGSWETDRGYVPAEGALYSEQGNPDIVMEKEYLELQDTARGATRAVFQFRNTSSSAVTAECGFPVDFELTVRQVTLDGKGHMLPAAHDPQDAQGAPGSRDSQDGQDNGGSAAAPAGSFQAWDFGDVVPSRYARGQDAAHSDQGFVNNVLSALSVPTNPWDAEAAMKAADDPDVYYAGTYFRDDQYPRGRKELDAARLRDLFTFRIQQDGRDVPVTTCVADFGAAPGRVVLHFRHRLSFAPGATSVVAVTYAMPTRSSVSAEPLLRMVSMHTTYTWNYILETASSWKDQLGRIVLSVPAELEKEPTAPWKYAGTRRGRLWYTAESWKPGPEANLSLSWTAPNIDYVSNWKNGLEVDPADLGGPSPSAPVKLLGASSFLAEKADVFLWAGIWRNAPFDPARLFDGLPETAWVVRTPRSGIGEYVRFAVTRNVDRVDVSNGYQRSTVDFPDKSTWSYFGKNNRVKTLDIVKDSGGLVKRLDLADSRDVQRFDIDLPPGTYRAVIAAVYPGSRWNDTCLGELSFAAGSAAGFDALDGDAFFGPLVR